MPYSANITLLVAGYLLGSLPFGLWVTKAWKGVDIRTVGSGNIGATNVWRVFGAKVGGTVFLLDMLKGLLPPLIAARAGFSSAWIILAGLFAILGHIYSFWLGFKGGKGMATGLGALIGVAPKAALASFGLWSLLYALTRFVSVASIAGAVSLSLFIPLFYPGDGTRLAFGILCGLLGLYTHRANIKRLRAGTEPRTQLFGKKPSVEETKSTVPITPRHEDADPKPEA